MPVRLGKDFGNSRIGKESTGRLRRPRFHPWVGKIPWRRAWPPTPVFLPGESHGQRTDHTGHGVTESRHDSETEFREGPEGSDVLMQELYLQKRGQHGQRPLGWCLVGLS